jgi:hypothetical protein
MGAFDHCDVLLERTHFGFVRSIKKRVQTLLAGCCGLLQRDQVINVPCKNSTLLTNSKEFSAVV